MTCKNQYALFLIDDMVVLLLLLFSNWKKNIEEVWLGGIGFPKRAIYLDETSKLYCFLEPVSKPSIQISGKKVCVRRAKMEKNWFFCLGNSPISLFLYFLKIGYTFRSRVRGHQILYDLSLQQRTNKTPGLSDHIVSSYKASKVINQGHVLGSPPG